ncbi:hypothetical protein EPN52_06180 [bacterium]|nr:MAG: hypothetical protein EPN52_06180 [bacterium]
MNASRGAALAGAGIGVGLAAAMIYRSTHSTSELLPELRTVPYVDLGRYQGRWFEIAKYPTPFQGTCAKNTTAEYVVRNCGGLAVENRCTTAEGRTRSARAVASVVDDESNAKLRLKYSPIAPAADYWIVDLDQEYRYAVIGEPQRRFLWILARTPALDEQTFEDICSRLREQLYDPARLERTPQDGA